MYKYIKKAVAAQENSFIFRKLYDKNALLVAQIAILLLPPPPAPCGT
jgi:hypothetical protein